MKKRLDYEIGNVKNTTLDNQLITIEFEVIHSTDDIQRTTVCEAKVYGESILRLLFNENREQVELKHYVDTANNKKSDQELKTMAAEVVDEVRKETELVRVIDAIEQHEFFLNEEDVDKLMRYATDLLKP